MFKDKNTITSSSETIKAEVTYLEFSDGKSHKFYEISLNKTEVTIRYGRIGTKGQSAHTVYNTPEQARAEATKKIHEKLKKGYIHKVPESPKKLDINSFKLPAWKPLVREEDSSILSSKFSGLPWLDKNETWPACPCCSQPMQLFLQLNTQELPEPMREEFGTGLIQMFHCLKIECAGISGNCVFSYGRYSEPVPTVLIRVIEPTTENLEPPISHNHEDFPPKTIVGWMEITDYPLMEDLVAIIYGWDRTVSSNYQGLENINLQIDLEDEVAQRLGLECTYDFYDQIVTYEGDKLAGYPHWSQGMEYPGCPICREPMRLVFQLASEDHLPYMFGDMGTGHIFQCKTHKDQMFFTWACS
jgi:predicted DNA-binding WGR domain protein